MSTRRFVILFVLAALIAAMGSAGLYFLLDISSWSPVAVVLWAILVLTGPMIYFLGKHFAASKSAGVYSVFSLLMISFRMFFAVLFFVGFAEQQSNFDVLWVWPFFWVYFIFTIFEVWLMMRLSYIKPKL